MKNLRKLLAVIVVVAVMLTYAIPAFAAVPSDVVGTDYEGAVARLMALGIVTGRPGGIYAPDDTISRAEFAAIIVRALGYEKVAAASMGTTTFSDVAPNFWAAGYINIATSLKIIKGRGDGTFGPNDPVLYQDAVTMIVRALGREAYAESKGGYPIGYLLDADFLGFTDGVDGVANLPASRGIVALLVDNAKTIKIWVQEGFGDSQIYKEGTESFMSKLGMEEVTGQIVTSTPGVSDLADGKFVAGGTEYTTVEGAVEDIEALLGKKVDIWKNSAGNVVMVEVLDSSTVTAAAFDKYDDGDDTVTIDVLDGDADQKYTIAAGAGALLNQKAATIADLFTAVGGAAKAENYELTLTLDGDGNVIFASALVFGDPVKLSAAPTVNNVRGFIRVAGQYYLRDDDKDPVKLVIVKDGEEVDYSDLEAGDIIMVAINNNKTATVEDDYIYIKATSETIEGTLTAARPNKTDATSVKVGGTFYDISVFKGDLDVSAFMGKDVILAFDPTGKVFDITLAEEEAADELYGVALAYDDDEGDFDEVIYKVRMLTADGTKVVYEVDGDALSASEKVDLKTLGTQTAKALLIKYTLNADGIIDSFEIASEGAANDVDINIAKGKIGSTYVTSDMVLFGYEDDGDGLIEADEFEVLTFDDLDDSDDVDVKAWFLSDDDEVVAALISNYTSAGTQNLFAYLTDYYELEDGKYTLIMWTLDGEVEMTATTVGAAVYTDAVIKYDIAAGEATKIVNPTAKVEDKDIESVSSTRIKVDGKYYYFTDDTIIIDISGDEVEQLTKDELYADMVVDVYVTDPTNVNDIDITVLVVKKR